MDVSHLPVPLALFTIKSVGPSVLLGTAQVVSAGYIPSRKGHSLNLFSSSQGHLNLWAAPESNRDIGETSGLPSDFVILFSEDESSWIPGWHQTHYLTKRDF